MVMGRGRNPGPDSGSSGGPRHARRTFDTCFGPLLHSALVASEGVLAVGARRPP
jgi:hypothetical protein